MANTQHREGNKNTAAGTRVSIFSDRGELLAQMEAAMQSKTAKKLDKPVQVGALSIYATKKVATWQGQPLALSPKEFDILVVLAAHCGKAVSRDFLFDHLWSEAFAGEARLIDRHIMKLRQKLGAGENLLETIRGVGYRLVAPPGQSRKKSRGSENGAQA